MMEDGKGCVIVRGLEEEAVYSANEIYNLLERGAAKRRTADTLLNKHSSRSHSVFTIMVYIKEATVGDEEMIKCGKLNLVDLAGSENISRSGAREGRAREAGEINKSLLTLGRVINALVEHSGHVPYRDSKLTRLLRDSLGGKTKTCVIATISPSMNAMEETLSTLDYACRAKNIKNKPEANQRISKAALLKDLYMEMERMKQDVRAAREKNGVYIPQERYEQDEAEKKARNEKVEQLETDLATSAKEVDKFRDLYNTEQEEKLNLERELGDCKINLEKSNRDLQELQESHKVALSTIKEKEFIISRLLNSENALVDRAKELRIDLQNASEDITTLFTRIDNKSKIEAGNHELILTFGSQLDQSLKSLHKTILSSVSHQQQHLKCMEEHVGSFLASKCDAAQSLESRIKKMTETYTSGIGALKELSCMLQMKRSSDLEQIKSTISSQTNTVDNFLAAAVLEGNEFVSDIQNSIDEQKRMFAASALRQEEGLQCSLVSAKVISEATVNFFNDLYDRASTLMKTIQENQIERGQQLQTFEMMFKEAAAREEKIAMEKIASILATMTMKKTSMLSEASRNIQDSSMTESKRLRQEVSDMQQISGNAKVKIFNYVEKVKSNFLEDTFSSAETRTALEECLQECSEKLNDSRQHWENAQSWLNHNNMSNVAGIESSVKANICSNNTAHKEFVSESSYLKEELDAKTSEILVAVNDSLMLDRKIKKELDSMSTLGCGQLKSVQRNHGDNVSKIRKEAEKSLTKDYMLDEDATPEKREIDVPTLASIEEMRANVSEIGDPTMENISNSSYAAGSKLHQHTHTQQRACPNRTPFADVN